MAEKMWEDQHSGDLVLNCMSDALFRFTSVAHHSKIFKCLSKGAIFRFTSVAHHTKQDIEVSEY
jgi:hypothetical protein